MLSFINRFKAAFLEPPEPTRLSANDNAALLNSTSYFLINANLSFLKKIGRSVDDVLPFREICPCLRTRTRRTRTRISPTRTLESNRGPIVALAQTQKCPRPFGPTLSKYSALPEVPTQRPRRGVPVHLRRAIHVR